ncbi:penicillin acylase family protein [Pararhodospirillum oryzae]|uniref:Penicillin amidase n=1 Tax=Pararhodospirillum oryzae TaxID=478448 RepID=A0A512H511_9PROT|nr:penicillin acylase family protein [Pararhodospirillum oryzae]GEO80470.1 penicillin amidase [Pararhodospirillum oryzae]
MRILALILAVLFALLFALWVALSSSMPLTSGAVAVPVGGALPAVTPADGPPLPAPGLEGGVTITRDRYGIPTIRAISARDAAFGLGFVHAQDRLWQMESMRRLGQGRLAELLGAPVLPLDRFTRALGLVPLAEAAFQRLPAATRARFEAYAAGVNHAVRTHTGALPPEFLVLLHRPEPWRPVDSLLWGRLMGLWLSADWTEELVRAAMLDVLDARHLRSLWPALADTDLDAARALFSAPQARAALDALPAALAPTLASNAWAVGGALGATGGPLLAGDPHLGFQAPIQWYLARLETPEGSWTGATTPGVPLVIIGHGDHVAWSFTTTHADTADLFVEQPVNARGEADPGGDHVLTPQGPRPFKTRTEILKVRFGDPETLVVRETEHGPVVSDVLLGRLGTLARERSDRTGRVLTLATPVLAADDDTALALDRLGRARSAAEVLEALHDFGAPSQTLVFATRDGAIGRVSPGRIPLRAQGPARLPTPGWEEAHQWTGYAPFEALPQALDPPEGFVFNTNSRLVPRDPALFLADEWPGEARAARLERLLAHKAPHAAADMTTLQMDTVSVAAARLLPILLDFPEAMRASDPALARAWALLADPGWQFDMAAPRPEPLVWAAWLQALVKALYADEMGPAWPLWARVDPPGIARALTRDTFWCDDVATPETETCDALKARTLAQAVQTVFGATGDGAAPPPPAPPAFNRAWGSEHRARFKNPFWSQIPVPGLDALTTLEVPTGGDDFTLSRGSWTLEGPDAFTHHHGAGMRLVVDLATPDEAGFILATGQSGHPLSPHYADMLPLWQAGRLIAVNGKDASGGTLVLAPTGLAPPGR